MYLNFDVNDIKIVECSHTFFHNGVQTTCKYEYYLKMPKVLERIFGNFYGTYTAMVKCHKDDVYSHKLGEKLALAKAEARTYKIAAKKIVAMIDALEDMLGSATSLAYRFVEKANKAANHNIEYMEWLTDDHAKLCGTNEDEDSYKTKEKEERYSLTDRSCFALALYEAGLFVDDYPNSIQILFDKRVDDMWDLFEFRMVKNGYRSNDDESVEPNKETSPAEILKGVFHAFDVDTRRDYHGDETVNKVMEHFSKNLKKQGYDVV